MNEPERHADPSEGHPGPAPEEAPRPDRKDLPRWTRYVEVLGRPLSAIIAGLAVAYIGYLGQTLIQDQQTVRTYTEILSQREQAESTIRRDMFVAILQNYFANSPPDSANIDDQLLRLEVLALNFSETLSLRPLFRALDRTINQEGTYSGVLARVDRANHRKRLRSLAKRVTGWQLSRLAVVGKTFEHDYDVGEMRRVGRVTWSNPGLDVDGVTRDYTFTVSHPDTVLETVDVKVGINPRGNVDMPLMERSFTLSYYDFPLIDNTRLSHDQRFAVVLSDLNRDNVRLEIVIFPGKYATQREASSLPALIEDMRKDERE